MTIDPELEGLWRWQSEISDGREHPGQPWHYLFKDAMHKEIVPEDIDDGKLRSTYTADVSKAPRRLEITLDYNGPDGPPDPDPIILRGVYEIDGDQLRLTYGVDEEYPPSISDRSPYTIKTLVRDSGPIPEMSQPSGTPPIQHPVLGELAWNDNLRWYEGTIQFNHRSVRVSVNPDEDGETENAILRANAIVENAKHYALLIKGYAVDGLLDLKNDSWIGENQSPVSSAQFVDCMVLESITVYSDGRAEFWHQDGGLFLGHSIQVSIDASDICTLTDIPG